MNNLVILSLSLVLFLVAFPLISIGTMQDSPVVWLLGLLALILGGLLPPASRVIGARTSDTSSTSVGLSEDDRV